ncbi:MAG: NPCBM/NEW2 domain-containing protein [Gemmataceae bacterium]|nr:NPCBM/NEW2 domain-containing protein [Gemmataceae bacterium]
MLRRFVLLSLLFACGAFAVADELRGLGKNVTGKLQSINDTEIVFKGDAGPVATPIAQTLWVDVAQVQPVAAGTTYSLIRLTDDSTLRCTSWSIKKGSLDATLTTGVPVQLPIAAVTQIVREANNAELLKKWEPISTQKIRGDRIVVNRDGILNPLEGNLGEADAEGKTIQFKREGADAIGVPLEKLHGLVFWRPDAPAESPIAKIIDRDGNVFQALKLKLDNGPLQVKTLYATDLSLPLEKVAKLDFQRGKLAFLSDLEPAKLVEKSAIGLPVRLKKDVNLDGEPIFLDRAYPKGLSMHAYTEVEYNLEGKYKELKGFLGVDARTGGESQAEVTIYCDGEKRYSEEITAKGLRPVSVNVKDVSILRIVVRSKNPLDLHDHVTFADARVSQ